MESLSSNARTTRMHIDLLRAIHYQYRWAPLLLLFALFQVGAWPTTAYAQTLDFGDAPNSYGTLSVGNGARHISGGAQFGLAVDTESNGQPTANADGDDINDTDDEDAFATMPRLTLPASPTTATWRPSLAVPCSPNGAFVVGYMDVDANGSFNTGQERSATATCAGGSATLNWTITTKGIRARSTHLRLRIAAVSAEIQNPTGIANTGEVEDYRFVLDPPVQPAFPACDRRAFLFQEPNNTDGYSLNLVTGVSTGIFQNMANQTNAIGFDQLDNYIWGVCSVGCGAGNMLTRVGADGSNTDLGPIPNLAIQTNIYNVGSVTSNGLYYVTNSELDRFYVVDLRATSPTYLTTMRITPFSGFDADVTRPGTQIAGGDWAFHPVSGQLYTVYLDKSSSLNHGRLLRIDPATGVVTNLGLLVNNTRTAPITFASTQAWGATFFDNVGFLYILDNGNGQIHRINITNPATPPGQYNAVKFAKGPKSDQNDGARCNLAVVSLDLGDAPDSYGTTLDSDGARHDNSASSSLRLGGALDFETNSVPTVLADHDDTRGVDDEDGVTIPALVSRGETIVISARINGTGLLQAWIDWNADGDFLDPGEQVATNIAASTGTVNLNVTVPVVAAVGTTYARFRISSAGLGPSGPAPDGEVEDYLFRIESAKVSAAKVDTLFIDADASGGATPGDTLFYTTTIVNSGGANATGMVYSDAPSANTTLVAGSVQTSAGTVTEGNTPGDSAVGVNVGTLASGGGTVRIGYRVTINNPLPADVTVLLNQGIVTVDNPDIPDIPTDDPDDPTPNDPTDTPVGSRPVLQAFKEDSVVDTDNSGTTTPGDTIHYVVVIVNRGNQDDDSVTFTDAIEENLTLVNGTVTTTVGTVTSGNAAGDSQVAVNVGTLRGQIGEARISFDAMINNPLPVGVMQVSNQGIVSDSDPRTPDELTGDPDTATLNDPTDTPVSAGPQIRATKSDILFNDVDKSGSVSPGDTLLYSVYIINNGNQAATGLTFADTPDANTTLIVGSVASSAGTITEGNTEGDEAVGVNIGTVAGGGGIADISFMVVINNPLPAGVTQVSNQGIVSGTGADVPDTPTDDPDKPGSNDPTDTLVIAGPMIDAFKRDILLDDADGNGSASPGDTLLYNVRIINDGNQAATGVVFADCPDDNITLVAGSVASSAGTIRPGNDAGDPCVGVTIDTLPGGGAFVDISYHVTINNPLPAGVTEVANQGIVSIDDPRVPDISTDDPDDPTPDDPTNTPVTATPQVNAFKRDFLLVDADRNGSASPGDTLPYNIRILNSGNQSAIGLSYTDNLDPNVTMVAGSVKTDHGTIVDGNDAGDRAIIIDIGTLPGGAEVNISFRVTINHPLPAGVTEVSNQGIIASTDPMVPEKPTDDPDDPTPDDPTDTQVVADPQIDAFKSDLLFDDADGNGSASPGDTLLYTIRVINSGNEAAAGVTFTDAPDGNTTLVVGSVASSAGTVTEGNTAGDDAVGVNIGTLPGDGAFVDISFRVRINNPLPAGVTKVSNQGIVTSDDPMVPQTPTDDPGDPTPDDPTDTPVVAGPQVDAFKRDILLVDADGNGAASPGDTLLYTVRVKNNGNQAATALRFTDNLDPNVAMVAGSVNTNRGTIVDGDDAGDRTVIVDIGTLPGGGAQAIISFRVRINNPLPAGVTEVSNQGIVTSNDPSVPDTPTDDPDDTTPHDPTDTLVVAKPQIDAIKRDLLLVDADGNGSASPGDTLLYHVRIINSGNQAATGLTFADTPDANTTLIVGSVSSSIGTIINEGNTAGDRNVAVSIGELPGGAEIEILFHVTIKSPLPAGVIQVSNQGVVTSDDPELPATQTDDPDDPTPDDPTDTFVVAGPQIDAFKRDTLFVDADGDGSASPGDTLLYNVRIFNNGNQAAAGLGYTDNLDPNVAIVTGSVNTDQGTIVDGNDAGDRTIIIEIGTLPGGDFADISFRVVIYNPLPAGVTQVSNQGIVSTSNARSPDVPTDDPDDPAPDDPTDTPVIAGPLVDAFKSDTLLVDADGNGAPSPSDTLTYNIIIINRGNQPSSALTYTDNPDANTTLVAGSVASSVGTVTEGNTAGNQSVAVTIGVLPGGGANTRISYQVVINTPLPVGVTQVSNQGIITSEDPATPDIPTDDPGDPAQDDPTDTPVDAAPHIEVFKTALILVDSDSNGMAGPGETLLYNISIINSGNQAATGLIFTDAPDVNTALIFGSVSSDHGTITVGNNAGDATISINVGTLPGGTTANISYRVTVDNPLPAGVIRVSNQGIVSGSDIASELSDDPQTPDEINDPTDVDVAAGSELTALKRDTLLIDVDQNGGASQGDTLLYNVTISNSGTTAATGVVYRDTPDSNTRLVVGSVHTSLGTVEIGNDTGDIAITIDVGELAVGEQVQIDYRVQVNRGLTEEVTQVSNQGIVQNDNDITPCPGGAQTSGTAGTDIVHCPQIPTNDPDTPEPNDRTLTPIIPPPTAEDPDEQPGAPDDLFFPYINR